MKTISTNIQTRTEVGILFVYLILFIIWPLLGFLLALSTRVGRRTKKLFFVLYFCFIGFNILFENVTGDAARYAEFFERDITFGFDIISIFAQGRTDVFTIASNYVIGHFTSNPHFLFAFWGGIFGMIVYLSLELVKKISYPNTKDIVAFLILLFLLNPHSNINGIRYWLTTWLFFYGILSLEYTKDYKSWIYIIICPFIHTSYIIPIIVYLIFNITHFSTKTLLSILAFSFIFGQMLPTERIIDFLPFVSDNKHYSMYIDSNYIQNRVDYHATRSSMNVLMENIGHFLTLGFLYYLGIFKYLNEESVINRIYKYAICMSIFCYFMAKVPIMGRFEYITGMFVLVIACLGVGENVFKKRLLVKISMLLAFGGKIYLLLADMHLRLDPNYLKPIFYTL